MKMFRGLFITGTDTGVGKTYVSCAVLRALRKAGITPGALKPVCTGDRNDAKALITASGMREHLAKVNPVFLKQPLAPMIAARFEGRAVDLSPVWKTFKEFKKKYEFNIVEGVGGLLVPVDEKHTVLDMIKRMKLPALVVARPSLGTINHTLLTVKELRRARIDIAGVVLSGIKRTTLAEKTNPSVIRELTGLPVLELAPGGGIDLRENMWIIRRNPK